LSLSFAVAVVVAFAYQLINLTAYKLKKRIQSDAQKAVNCTPKVSKVPLTLRKRFLHYVHSGQLWTGLN